MKKIATIVGARPQFIKAAAISRVLLSDYAGRIEEAIVHSGQHYDYNMSKVFFDEMEIPEPAFHLEVGSGTHGYQTGMILQKAEEVLSSLKPDMVIVFGDTNTTLAGALAAAKLHIPVAHIEAGLRSFNKAMPEEINRILCDNVSTLLFSPTETGFSNLLAEGFPGNSLPPYSADHPKIYHCGDVMYDNALLYSRKAEDQSKILKQLDLQGRQMVLCTIHRDVNTDDRQRLNSIFKALNDISKSYNILIVLPIHPRTEKMLPQQLNRELLNDIKNNSFMRLIGPVSYFDMLLLEKNAQLIITDSGGVQKESYFFRKPCIVLRSETEWKELVDVKTAMLADADEVKIKEAFRHFYDHPLKEFPSFYGDGNSASFICNEIFRFLST